MSPGIPVEGVDLRAVPRLNESVDLMKLSLSMEEGFLISRVDGSNTIDAVVKLSGFNPARAVEMLLGLRSRDLIFWEGAAGAGGSAPGEDYDPADLEAGIDLPVEVQKKILALFKRKDEMNYYELLGVDRRADAKEIKRAYFKVSKDYHPDTYFRKHLGTFKSKVVALFKLVSKAHEVLSNGQKRAEYDATLPYLPTAEELEQAHEKEARKEGDARLKDERRRRLIRITPLAQRKRQARAHFKDAEKHWEEKNPLKAANSVRLALTLDPGNPDFQALMDEVGPKAAEIRAEKEYKRGRYEESIGNWEVALDAYMVGIELNPDESRALHRAAVIMLELARDLKTALSFCRRAQRLDPETSEIVKTAADLYVELGMTKNALREYERYLKVNPFDEKVQEKVDELRKRK